MTLNYLRPVPFDQPADPLQTLRVTIQTADVDGSLVTRVLYGVFFQDNRMGFGVPGAGTEDLTYWLVSYYLQQEELLWSQLRINDELLDPTFSLSEGGNYLFSQPDTKWTQLRLNITPKTNEPRRRLGDGLLGRYGWVTFARNGYYERPQYINAEQQVLFPEGGVADSAWVQLKHADGQASTVTYFENALTYRIIPEVDSFFDMATLAVEGA